MKSPTLPKTFEDLPSDTQELHESCVALFGDELFRIRRLALRECELLCESEEVRHKLATIYRRPYEAIATLEPAARQSARRMAQDVVDRFILNFLCTMAHGGNDQRLDARHAMRYRVELEIIDTDTDEIVHCETVNRGGSRFFVDYWGRWLNAFGDLKSPKDDTQSA